MKRVVPALVASIAPFAAMAQSPAQPPVAVRVERLPQHVRERVQAHADQGITSLARYLELTRTVYQLHLMDVLAGYERSGFFVDDTAMTDRQVEDSIREGKLRPVK